MMVRLNDSDCMHHLQKSEVLKNMLHLGDRKERLQRGSPKIGYALMKPYVQPCSGDIPAQLNPNRPRSCILLSVAPLTLKLARLQCAQLVFFHIISP